MSDIAPALLSLLGGIDADCYAARAPQKARAPYLVYQQVFRSGIADSLDGPSPLVQQEWQVDSYATTYAAARGLAAQARSILNGHRGPTPCGSDSPQATLRIGAIRLTGEMDLPDDAADPKLFRVMQEYLITFDEA